MGSIVGKRMAPVILTAIFGIIMILNFFLNIPALASFAAEAQRMFVPIVASAGVVGGVNLLLYHFTSVSRRRGDWQLSALLIGTFFFFLVITITPGLESFYALMYPAIVGRLKEATWALISLFMVSMAYRSFKIRNLETLLFTIGCVVILFGNAPVGEAILPGAVKALRWFMDVPTMAGMRAITIGVGLGIIAYGVRVMLGYDRTALGEFSEEV